MNRCMAVLILSGALLWSCNGKEKKAAVPAKPPAGKVTGTPPAEKTPVTPEAAEKGVADEAKSMLDQAMKMINEKDFDGAKGLLTKLVAMKDKLPADMQKQIDDAMTLLEGKDALGGLGFK